MTPEAYISRADERCEHTEEKAIENKDDTVNSIATDLVGRIDRFINDNPAAEVRRVAQSRVHESLQVIQRALNDYGYSNHSRIISLY